MNSISPNVPNDQYSLEDRNLIIGFILSHTINLVANAFASRCKRFTSARTKLRRRINDWLKAEERIDTLVDIKLVGQMGYQQIY